MARTPRERLAHQLDVLDDLVEDGDLDDACRDKLVRFAKTVDKDTTQYRMKGRDGDVVELEPRSVEVYVRCLRIASQEGIDLLDTSADEFNACMDRMHTEDGKSKRTLVTYQSAARAFYRCFDLGVDPESIAVFNPDSTPKHDERDMFTEDDVWALRDACGRTRMPTRNRAFLELLVHTVQRVRALATLKLGDVDIEGGYFYLNDEVDGLKGATKRGLKRPMFGARKYVRDWVNAHPSDDPDSWLFVGDPSHWKTDPEDHWAEVSIDRVLRRMGEDAGVDKPMNAHNFRHYCVTVLRRDYHLDWDTINMLAGVVEGSDMPRTTYSHIDDDEFIQRAEAAMGYVEEEDAGRFTPPVCPTCAEVLKPNWRECPACREIFAPDAREKREAATDDATDELIDDRLSDVEKRAVAAALKAVRHDD